MFPTRRSFAPYLITVAVLGLALISPSLSSAEYQEPDNSPPEYSELETDLPAILPVLNNTYAPQQKTGSLLIGERNGEISTCKNSDETGCSSLCLNPDTTQSGGGTGAFINNLLEGGKRKYCITNWSQLRGWVENDSIKYLNRYSQSQTGNDSGYVALQATPTDVAVAAPKTQQFTMIAKASGWGVIDPSAIRAEGLSDSYYAAQFLGTVNITGTSASSVGQICLNDKATSNAGFCISQWSDIVTLSGVMIVRLQNLRQPQVKSADYGSTATGGVLVAGKLIAGSPVLATPIGYTCGDGICQYPQENLTSTSSGYCPTDCADEAFYLVPDFSHLYAGDGYGCEDTPSGGAYSITFKVQNLGSSTVRATPHAGVALCSTSNPADGCSAVQSGSISPSWVDVDPDQTASFTYTTQPGIRPDNYYRYSFWIDNGNTVTSNITWMNCQF